MNANTRYSFSPVTAADMALLAQWLNDPEVARWFDDDEYLDELESQLDKSHIRMQLVHFNNKPFAFVQDYDPRFWEDHHLFDLPEGSRGIDTFIGNAEHMGHGHGTRYLGLLVADLLEQGAPALGIDPHPDNLRAQRAYQNVGFEAQGVVNNTRGTFLVMLRYAQS